MIKTIKTDGKTEWSMLAELAERMEETGAQVRRDVEEILRQVKLRGDEAVTEYTQKFDGKCPAVWEVSREEINDALSAGDEDFVTALLAAQENLVRFHSEQKQRGYILTSPTGSVMGQQVRGLDRVGLYVPGGTAAYPSTVLMNCVPAKIAGVGEIIMCTPPGKDGKANRDILTAAAISGVDRVFLMGGAQAAAAMAYGTKTVPPVDKIVGPGNIFVATAKRQLYGVVDIDMIAGPSEILILADKNARPDFIAADMIGQAEHDALASAMLLTTSEKILQEVQAELEKQTKGALRETLIRQSLGDYGLILLCDNTAEMVELANAIAPEHLEVMLENPMQYLGLLRNAGSIFLGSYAPEALGDYYGGPNHVLPTGKTARFFSPLGVESFQKKTSFIAYTKTELSEARADICAIAVREGLQGHRRSIEVRFAEDEEV